MAGEKNTTYSSFPKTTPDWIVVHVRWLERERDENREAMYKLRGWLEKHHPEVIREYDNSRLISIITGEEMK